MPTATDEGTVQFRLSVWRPARLGRQLHYFPEVGESIAAQHDPTGRLLEHSALQEELYLWDPGKEDIWSSIKDSKIEESFRDSFLRPFAPSLAPKSRSLAAFGAALMQFRKTAGPALSASPWALANQEALFGGERVNLRTHSLLAVLNHLSWIFATFEHVPGASVTIR
jgi:hypothetical protein